MTDPTTTAQMPFIPRSLGPYRIEGELGSGAMGTVFRATHTGLERPVALKVLRPETLEDPNAIRRFLREGRNIAALEHPHIVAVYDAGEIDGVYYIAMKLLEGVTLQTMLSHTGMLSTDRTIRLISQLAGALHYAHGRGVIHCDIKPANVIVAENDRTTLTDFGIAQAVHTGTARSATITGTPLYMSPEQILGASVDARSDIYSLGIVLYELLAGRPPFQGQFVSVMYAHLNSPLPDIRTLVPNVPEHLAQIVQRATAKKPEERFQNAGDMLATLVRAGGEGAFNPGVTVDVAAPDPESTAVLAPDPVQPAVPLEKAAPVTRPAPSRKSRTWFLALGALVAAIAAVAAFLALRPQSPSTGTLTISSAPVGASVTIDGSHRGSTPLTMSKLRAGSHTVRISLPTFRTKTVTATVPRGKTASLRVSLSSVSPATLVKLPAALLTTSFTSDPTTHQVVPGPLLSSLPVSSAMGRNFYVLAQFQARPAILAKRTVRFTPTYALFDPKGLPLPTSRSHLALTLSKKNPTQVWEAAFRLRMRGSTRPPLGVYSVRIQVGAHTMKTLTFTLTA